MKYAHRTIGVQPSHRASLASSIGVDKDREVLPVVHFETQINGRAYVIEVSAVGRDRWRAEIARTPGNTTALMPFYGTTPDEAAERLSGWLTRAAH
jgi:hypothetical protein